MNHNQISLLVQAETERARALFPSRKHLLHAFTEEAGEVTKAFLQSNEGKGTDYEIVKELIQCMAMATRLLQEGDPDFPALKPMPEFADKVSDPKDA